MSSVTSDRAVLLMAHGSRDAEARAEYRRIHEALVERLAPNPVVFSVLEFPGEDGLPSIQQGWQRCLEAGAKRDSSRVQFPVRVAPIVDATER